MAKITCNVSKIAEEVIESYNGGLVIRNLGGGLLYGNIMADDECVSFDETEFEGNEIELKYNIDVKNCTAKKFLKFNIYIVSNGGEVIIPVFIKVLKDIFYTDDNYKIVEIKDLFSYYKKKPKKAVNVFYSEEFMDWLLKIDFEYVDVVKFILKDVNRERAIENFFILSKLKKRCLFEIIEKNINISVKPFQTDILSGSVVILKKGYGYIYKELKLKYDSKWFKIKKSIITSDDFDDENRCYINYEINPKLIDGNFSRECIIIDENTEAKINITKLPKIVVSLSSEIYEYDDFGSVIIENNCGKDLIFEFSSKDSFIEFEKKHCLISETDNVFFKIKRSKMQNFINKVSFSKKLYIESEIYVTTVVENQIIKKIKKIVLGTSLL